MLDMVLQFLAGTGFALVEWRNIVMIIVGILFLYLALGKNFEPLLMIPIGFGAIVGNIPFTQGFGIGLYEAGSVLNYMYSGVTSGVYPALVFLGLGAMTDFRPLLSKPKLMLLGAVTQGGVFITLIIALGVGFATNEAASMAIMGVGDGPTSVFLTAKLAPHLIAAVAFTAYFCTAAVSLIQTPIMRLLTTPKERVVHMPEMRAVSRKEVLFFPIVGLIIACVVAPAALSLLAPLFLGNFVKEVGVTDRLGKTASSLIIDAVTIFLGFSIGCATQGDVFVNFTTLIIIVIGLITFSFSTVIGVVFAKIMNLFTNEKLNPLLGAAGVAALPSAAREVHNVAAGYDETNYLLTYGMACNISGIMASAFTAGILLGFLMI